LNSTSDHYSVYILRCRDKTYYTGITNDLPRRIKQHNTGTGAKYTRGRSPVKLVYKEEGLTKSEALKREHEIKQLSRAEKIALLDTIR
jgi:putative endonuclease